MTEAAADFYSSRIPKRQRKSNLIDELLADAKFRRYVDVQCEVFNIIQERSVEKHFRANLSVPREMAVLSLHW